MSRMRSEEFSQRYWLPRSGIARLKDGRIFHAHLPNKLTMAMCQAFRTMPPPILPIREYTQREYDKERKQWQLP